LKIVRVALIGYGEVGKILAEDLRSAGHAVSAFDVKLGGESAGLLHQHAHRHGVVLAASHAAAVQGAELVISAVTASQTVAVAQACAPALHGAFFLDFNSASPGAKAEAATHVDGAGGRYVEGAVMTLISGYRIRVPLLLGGPHAAALLPLLSGLGFSAQVASEKLGVASATKLCRSVMIKGLEAMLIESLTTARHYGVEDAVLASLQETYPGVDWPKQATYAFQRVIEHGRRRGEEMQEAARTVRDTGLQALSAQGTAQRDTWVAEQGDAGVFGTRGTPGFARSQDWRLEADRILATLTPATPKAPT
jgi:3-hydroxyisobutyrate dehydrogenase-like beta-hydroxyacid dehydrogenase